QEIVTPKPIVTSSAVVADASNPALEADQAEPPVNVKEILGLQVENKPYLPYKPIETGSPGGLLPDQQAYLESFMQRYCERTKESKQLTQRFRRYLADGANSATFRPMWKEIVYQIHGRNSSGSKIWDVDGNEYLDITMGFGVHLFGHSPDFITKAINEQLARGVALGPQSSLAEEAAKLMCEMTGLDRAVFCNSGTEAVMAALR